MGAGLATSISRERPDFSAQPILAITANILQPNNFVGSLLWDLSPIGPPEIRHLVGYRCTRHIAQFQIRPTAWRQSKARLCTAIDDQSSR
jgi:hypothetical protein